MSRKTLVLVGVIAVVLAGAIGGYRYWTHSPRYSLRQAADAIREHDIEKFRQYVDIEDVAEDYVAAMMKEASSGEEEAGGLFAGMMAMMQPRLEELVERQIEDGVESGDWQPDEESDEAPLRPVAHMLPADQNDKEPEDEDGKEEERIRVGEIRVQGRIALADLEIFDPVTEAWDTLKLNMRDLGDHWQVSGLDNVNETFATMQKRHAEKLAEINRPIREQLSASLGIGAVIPETYGGRWERKVRVTWSATNNTEKSIRMYVFTVSPTGQEEPKVPIVAAFETLPPKTTQVSAWGADINEFIDREKALYDAAQRHDEFRPKLLGILFEDGEEIRIRDNLSEPEAGPLADLYESYSG